MQGAVLIGDGEVWLAIHSSRFLIELAEEHNANKKKLDSWKRNIFCNGRIALNTMAVQKILLKPDM